MFVSPEYFPMLRIPIVRGRGFLPGGGARRGPRGHHQRRRGQGALAGRRSARQGRPDPDRTGLRPERARSRGSTARPPTGPRKSADIVIVGVARDVVSGLVFEGQDTSHLYLPTSPTGSHAGAILLTRPFARRTPGPASLQAILRKAHPDPLVFEVMPLDEMREAQMYPLRTASWIGSLLGAIALVLSVSGLYGVLTYTLEPAHARDRHPHGAGRDRPPRWCAW